MPANQDKDPIIQSPCIRQCCLDAEDICVGCFRSITEIMDWQKSTHTQKQEVLANCALRKQKHDAKYS